MVAVLEFNMILTLNQKAYAVGDYFDTSERRILTSLNPTGETSTYGNIFDVELKNNKGDTIEMEVVSVTKKAQNPRQLHFEIKLNDSVEDGTLYFTNKQNALLRGNEGPDNVYFGDQTMGGITAEAGSGAAALEAIGNFSAPAIKSATLLTMLVSMGSSIALIKIFQMMDYMLFFNVNLPPIFGKYLEIFSTNFFNDFPNLLIMFVDDKCPKIKEKFLDEDMSCQFLSNCGSLIFIMILTFIFKGVLWMSKSAVTTSGQLKGKLGIFITKADSLFGYEFYLGMLDMFQLDFYLAIFLQLDNMVVLSPKSAINIAVSLICMILFMFIKLMIFFYSTRVAIISKEASRSEKGYKKYYYNFLFLGEENKHETFYQNHQMILNMLKDPVLGVALVFFYNTPVM